MAKDRPQPRTDAVERTVKEEARAWAIVAGLISAWVALAHVFGG